MSQEQAVQFLDDSAGRLVVQHRTFALMRLAGARSVWIVERVIGDLHDEAPFVPRAITWRGIQLGQERTFAKASR